MITKETKIDKIEIVGDFKCVQLREKLSIIEDGVEISSTFHRRVITPNDDITAETQEIKDICAVIHTNEIITSYMSHISGGI